MLTLGIAGIAGRMGGEVLAAARTTGDLDVAGGVDLAIALESLNAPDLLLTTDLAELLPRIDLLIDFSAPVATATHATACAAAGVPLVTGVTGLAESQLADLHAASQRIAVLHSRNMSPGVAALAAVLPLLARNLPGDDIEIIETHHRHKKDAPSGTAFMLAETLAAGPGAGLDDRATYGRHGLAPRAPGEIGIHAVRAGGNPGEHTIVLAGETEEIRITHRVFARRAFALGALRAARWLVHQPPGLYTMADVFAS